jgi:uncharacterized protein
MALSMYQATVPVFIHMLNNLSSILTKASHYAEAKKVDPAVLMNARLAPDMFALARQVQIAADLAKGCGARLAEIEIPTYADTETTFAELHERITKTVHFLKSINKDQFNGCEERQIILKIRGNDLHFSGLDYVLSFVTPNFYFHVTTAYNILRHNGVEIGKMDFLGAK